MTKVSLLLIAIFLATFRPNAHACKFSRLNHLFRTENISYSREKSQEIEAGKNYRVYFRNSKEPAKLELVKIEGEKLLFKDRYGNKKESLKRDLDLVQLKDSKEPTTKDYLLAGGVSLLGLGLNIQKILSMRFGSYTRRRSASGVKVVGRLFISGKQLEKTLDDILRFDEFAASMAYRIPEKTKVIISDGMGVDMTGPAALQTKKEYIIDMAKILYFKESTRDPSILYHERMHNVLHETYGQNSYINRTSATQEALVDFFSYLKSGDPVIGRHLLPEFVKTGIISKTVKRYHIRDIKDRTNGGWRLKTLAHMPGDYHGNSVYLSNLLFRVEQFIGREQMASVMKPFTDRLANVRGNDLRHTNSFVEEMQVFTRELKATLKETGNNSAVRKVEEFEQELGFESKQQVTSD